VASERDHDIQSNARAGSQCTQSRVTVSDADVVRPASS